MVEIKTDQDVKYSPLLPYFSPYEYLTTVTWGTSEIVNFCRFFWNHPRGRRKGIFSKICSNLPTCVWKHQSKFSTKLAFASSSKPHPSDCSKHGQLVSFFNHLPSKLTASSQPSSDRLFIIFYKGSHIYICETPFGGQFSLSFPIFPILPILACKV